MGQSNFQLRVLGQPLAASWTWDSVGDGLRFIPVTPAELAITGTPPASAIAGAFYSFTPGVSGGTPPYSFGLTGDLPPGLTFDPATGTISGTAL